MTAGRQRGTDWRSATIERVDAFVFRAPCRVAVRTSFGVMHDRPALLLRIRDQHGLEGWGEVWCNFPSVGADHRASLVRSLIAPSIEGTALADPASFSAALADRFAVLAIQSGEFGPIAQTLAGVDQALWDLAARRAGVPLWRLLGGAQRRISVYASGLGPDGAIDAALAARDRGHRAFKLKVGFEPAADLRRLRALRDALGEDAMLMVDANQAWRPEAARMHCAALSEVCLAWIEEPLRADESPEAWRELASQAGSPLAGGENLIGRLQFDAAIAERSLQVIQPDVAKWGGITGCLAVGRAALAAGLRYCPHFLGAGIGLLHSAHLLAAAGGDGLLEMDSNENPLRDLTASALPMPIGGGLQLAEDPGIGQLPDLDALARYAVS